MMNKRYLVVRCDHFGNNPNETTGITTRFLGRTDDLEEALNLLKECIVNEKLKDPVKNAAVVYPEHIQQNIDMNTEAFYYIQDLRTIDTMANNINFSKAFLTEMRALNFYVIGDNNELRI